MGGSDRRGDREGILGHRNCFLSWCGWWLCACILFVKIHCPVPSWIMPFSICMLYFINKFTCKKYRHCLIYLELTTNWVWICFRGTCASSEKISCYHFSVLWICSPWVDPRYHLQEHMELLQARQSKVLFRSLLPGGGRTTSCRPGVPDLRLRSPEMGVGEFPSTGRSLKRKTFRFFLHFVLLGGCLSSLCI